MYERVIAAFPDALLEDAHDLPEVARAARARGAAGSPTTRRSSPSRDLDATPLAPRAVNIKPCRVGDLRSLFDVYAACEARGLITYGGGMGELDVGRGQIQLLASLFHADAPNDVAPSGYNADTPARRPSRQPAARRTRRRPGSVARSEQPSYAPGERASSPARASMLGTDSAMRSHTSSGRRPLRCRRR